MKPQPLPDVTCRLLGLDQDDHLWCFAPDGTVFDAYDPPTKVLDQLSGRAPSSLVLGTAEFPSRQ